MRVVLLGPPGAGKGSQAEKISKKYGIVHISTGNIMREFRDNKTELGYILDAYMSKGLLVPDDITLKIVKERIEKDDCKDGYLLDGFPRTIPQAEEFESFLGVDVVINLGVDRKIILERLAGRRTCSKCSSVFHTSMIGKASDCPKCKGKLIKRDDETDEAIAKRLEVYDLQTRPLIYFYAVLGKLEDVDGNRPIDEVFESITDILNKL